MEQSHNYAVVFVSFHVFIRLMTDGLGDEI